jgi:hypothetical protein
VLEIKVKNQRFSHKVVKIIKTNKKKGQHICFIEKKLNLFTIFDNNKKL